MGGLLRTRATGVARVALFLALLVSSGCVAPSAQPSVQAELQRVEERAAQLRELAPTGPITHRSLPRAELRAYLESKVLEDNSAEEIEANEVRWEVLGYVTPGLDLIHIFLDVLGEQVLGFYDPEARSLYLVGSQGDDDSTALRPADVVTLAHEVTHALQDQHYDIRAGQEARRNENDRQLAYQALVEGDAVLLSGLYAQRYLTPSELREVTSGSGDGSTAALDAAPLIIQRELVFPYIDGTAFLATQYRRGGWAAVDRLWDEPPSSTEQILHPQKYQAGEAPVALSLPDLTGVLGPEWRLLEENTLGELDWRVLFEQYTDARTGEQVGTGWGGDRFQLFKRDRDNAVLLAGRTAWDSEADAGEFFDTYPRLAAGRYGAGLQTDGPTTVAGMTSWSGQAGLWRHELTVSQERVSYLISTDAAAARAVSSVLRP